MSKHTEGPWEVWAGQRRSEFGHFRTMRSVCGPEGQLVAYTDFYTAGVAKANARLIAAAPEMLEALKRIVEQSDALDELGIPALGMARAAIAKAEGRT